MQKFRSKATPDIVFALSKGRIFEETLPILEKAGIFLAHKEDQSRKLILETNKKNIRIILLRATDVPTYVEFGAADLGIAGKDVILEHGGSGIYQPIDLKIAKCKMVVAVKNNFNYEKAVSKGSRINVATKYVSIANNYFMKNGIYVNLIKLYGSMELAPSLGLSDAIVDLVSTGKTLRENNLKPVKEVMKINSKVVINKLSLKTKKKFIEPILEKLSSE